MRHLLIASILLVACHLGSGVAQGQPVEPVGNSGPMAACDPSAAGAEDAIGVGSESLDEGLDLAILADVPTDAWPRFARGLTLTLRTLTFDPGAASLVYKADGPLLYHVEQGSVGISINSQMTTHDAGDVVLVRTGQRYKLRNDAASLARVLRVQIVKPGDETSVNADWGGTAESTRVEMALRPPPYIRSRSLLSGDIPVLEGSQRVILGCLIWQSGEAETGAVTHAGPLGLVVLRGQMLVNDVGVRNPGECSGFQAGASHRLRAGVELPVVLVVAVIPGEGSWWGRGRAREVNTNLKFKCGEPAAPGDGP